MNGNQVQPTSAMNCNHMKNVLQENLKSRFKCGSAKINHSTVLFESK